MISVALIYELIELLSNYVRLSLRGTHLSAKWSTEHNCLRFGLGKNMGVDKTDLSKTYRVAFFKYFHVSKSIKTI